MQNKYYVQNAQHSYVQKVFQHNLLCVFYYEGFSFIQ